MANSGSVRRTTNWKSCDDALKRHGSLLNWLSRDIEWLLLKDGYSGCLSMFPDAVIRCYLMVKLVFDLPLRQITGIMSRIWAGAGAYWPMPDFLPLGRREKMLAIRMSSRRTTTPLNLRVDSTGIDLSGDRKRSPRTHGIQHRRQYRKAHLTLGVAAGDIRAAELTSSREDGSPILPDLPDRTPPEETMGTVTHDGAFDTCQCYTVIQGCGGTAVIPIRKSGRPWNRSPFHRARNGFLRASECGGRTSWRHWSGYHVQRRIEERICGPRSFGA
jgi:hypothetical protein